MTTRWMMLAVVGIAATLDVAGAQQPPTPPPSAPPPRAATPRPAPTPRPPQARPVRPAPEPADAAEAALRALTSELNLLSDEMRIAADLAITSPAPLPPIASEPALLADLAWRLQGTPPAPRAPVLREPIVTEPAEFHWPAPMDLHFPAPMDLHFPAPMDLHVPAPMDLHLPPPGEFHLFNGRGLGSVRVREPWARQDVGDSLYRSARNAFNRGDWGQASQLFGEIPTRYPNSVYAERALYYQAFALYRIGGTSELRRALDVLNTRQSKYPNVRTESDDAPVLATRIRGVLASRGDQQAAAELARTARQGQTVCDREEQAVQAEAMNALSRTDPDNVNQLIRRVLQRRDECAIPLRRSAVLLAANRRDAESGAILADVARNDPNTDVRSTAILAMARLASEEHLPVLEELVRTSDDERIQRAAVRALVQHPSARARTAVRALVERSDVSERLRSEALNAFTSDRATADDITWLRALYARLETPSLKQRALSAITRIGGPDVDQWLVSIVRNDNEPSDIRAIAMRRIGETMAIADLGRLYDEASQQRLRLEIISILGKRKEDAATDKLIDIVKNGTDPSLRTRAINAISNKNDARSRALLLEIINKEASAGR